MPNQNPSDPSRATSPNPTTRPSSTSSSRDTSSSDGDSSTGRFADLQSRASIVAHSAYDRVVAFCKENPKLAMGIGLTAGVLMTRRMFRR